MEIYIAQDHDKAKWDNAILKSDHGGIFDTWDWLKLLEMYGSSTILGRQRKIKLIPVMVFDKNELVGLMPIFFSHFFPIRKVYSPPFKIETGWLGPIVFTPVGIRRHRQINKNKEFIDKINLFIKNDLGATQVNIHTRPCDPRPFLWNHYTATPAFTYVLDLNKQESVIWDEFGKQLRQDINKLEYLKTNFKEGSKKEYNDIIFKKGQINKIWCKNEFYNDVFSKFYPDNLNVFYIEKDGKVLTGLIVFLYKKRIYAWMGVDKCDNYNASPNELLYWELIKWGRSKGYKELEIIGGDDQNLDPFKRKFNGELVEGYYLEYLSPSARFGREMYSFLSSIRRRLI